MALLEKAQRAERDLETMDGNNDNFAEKYRLAGEAWVADDSAARLLEETKSVVFSQMVSKQGDMPVSRAEHAVRSSDDWRDFISKMVEARTKANAAKVELRYSEMKFLEWQSAAATARAERRL